MNNNFCNLFWSEFSFVSRDALLVKVFRVDMLAAEASPSGRWDLLGKAAEETGSWVESGVTVAGALREDAVAGALLFGLNDIWVILFYNWFNNSALLQTYDLLIMQ